MPHAGARGRSTDRSSAFASTSSLPLAPRLQGAPHLAGLLPLCLDDLRAIQLILCCLGHAHVIVPAERSVGAPPQLDEASTGHRAEAPTALQHILPPIDNEAVTVANGATSQDVGEIMSKIDPRHGDGIQVAMHG